MCKTSCPVFWKRPWKTSHHWNLLRRMFSLILMIFRCSRGEVYSRGRFSCLVKKIEIGLEEKKSLSIWLNKPRSTIPIAVKIRAKWVETRLVRTNCLDLEHQGNVAQSYRYYHSYLIAWMNLVKLWLRIVNSFLIQLIIITSLSWLIRAQFN